MKNIIISSLIIYIFSTVPGWSVAGFEKFVLCVCLSACLSVCLFEIDLKMEEWRNEKTTKL